MPVIGRSPYLTVGSNGEILGVLAENIDYRQPPFLLKLSSDAGGTPTIYVQKDTRNQESTMLRGYGAGARVLFTIQTCERQPLPDLIPILALWADTEKGPYPLNASLIEGAVDPSLTYDPRTQKYHLYYWVNAWSPPGEPAGSTTVVEEGTLFQSVKPPVPTEVDSLYDDPNSEVRYPPDRTYTAVRDLPDWYAPGLEPSGEPSGLQNLVPEDTPTQEKIGAFTINRFWIAPWSDAHLYRFNSDIAPILPPPVNPPSQIILPPTAPPSPPPPPPVTPVPQPSFLDNIPFTSVPQLPTQQEVLIALYKYRNNHPLRPTEKATLAEYQMLPRRIANLARCTRVLMHATGRLMALVKKNDEELTGQSSGAALPIVEQIPPTKQSIQSYLVVDAPQPVMALPRSINKILVGRNKWTSYITGEDIYILAPLNYRWPAAGTSGLVTGNPQVDFMLHDPCDHLDAWKRGVHLPEADTPQRPQQLPQKDLLVPRGFGGTLVDLMSNMSLWQSY